MCPCFIILSACCLQLVVFTAGDLVVDRVVARLPDLGLEVEVDELVLLGVPVAVGVAVVDHLAGAGVAHLDGGVRERAVGRPGEAVAALLGDGEGLGAADVAVGVDALFDGVVEDGALGDGVASCGSVSAVFSKKGTRIFVEGRSVQRTLVRARPLVRSCWVVGRCMVSMDSMVVGV